MRRMALAVAVVVSLAVLPACGVDDVGPDLSKCCQFCEARQQQRPCGDVCISATAVCSADGGCACAALLQ